MRLSVVRKHITPHINKINPSPNDIIIYVLCYNDVTEQKAVTEFGEYKWARIYRIKNQSHLHEGVFFSTELISLYNEWKDKKFVGTISYEPFGKIPKSEFFKILNDPETYNNDVVFFSYFSNTFHSFMHHDPRTSSVFYSSLSKAIPNISEEHTLLTTYCNYFMATPEYMVKFLNFFAKEWLPVVESHPDVWTDSGYDGKLKPDQLLKLNGRVPYYPQHPFVNERITCVFYRHIGARCKGFNHV
jgi:hypothetical protein